MPTRDYSDDGQTRGQELHRMEQSSPPSPNRPSAPGSGVSGGGEEIAGTRAAPNGKVMGHANRYATGFLQSVPGAARLARQMRQPQGSGMPGPDYSDLNTTEALQVYERLVGQLPADQRADIDLLAARLREQ